MDKLAKQEKKRKEKPSEMFVLNQLKVQIKRDQKKIERKRRNSLEEKSKMRLERKNPSQRRIETIKHLIHSIVERPIEFICKLTIPTSERNKWHRGFASFNPIGSLLIIMIASDSINFYKLP